MLPMFLAMLSSYLHVFSFSGGAIAAKSTGMSSLEYTFCTFTHWILLSLDNDRFETIGPSINDDVTFFLPFSLMLIEGVTPDNPRMLFVRLSVTKVPWLHVSNNANADTSLSELQCLNWTDTTHILLQDWLQHFQYLHKCFSW